MPKKSTRKNTAVSTTKQAVRKNAGDTGLPTYDPYGNNQMGYAVRGRYVDPLVFYKKHNKDIPEAREAVAEADAIASVLTYCFANAAWSKMPKFYESDQLDAPEIMQDLRALLKVNKFEEIGKTVFLKGETHGWFLNYPFLNPTTGLPSCEIYSEYECPALMIHYDMDNNIEWYRIQVVPRVTLARRTALRQINRTFYPQQVIHGTRGEWQFGFGHSVFEGCWDAITKLREESHVNAFKQKVMPWVKVPQDWSDTQIDDFLRLLSEMDNFTGMIMRSHENMDGTQSDLPLITWATPVNNTAGKSGQGSGGSVSDLSSEWARLTASTRHSVGYFTGGGAISASMAAAGVDSLDDFFVDVENFNQYLDSFIIPYVRWFAAAANYPLPDSFTVKGWWEWTRDEAIAAQNAAQNLQIEMQQQAIMQKAQDAEEEDTEDEEEGDFDEDEELEKTEAKQNMKQLNALLLADIKQRAQQRDDVRYDLIPKLNAGEIPTLFSVEVGERGPNNQVIRHYYEIQANDQADARIRAIRQYSLTYGKNFMYVRDNTRTNVDNTEFVAKCNIAQTAIEQLLNTETTNEQYKQAISTIRQNISPNVILPVNSASENVEQVMLEPGQGGADTLWVKYKSPYDWYSYQDTSKDMNQIGDLVQAKGGDAVWSQLRGLGNAPLDENGHLPKGIPKKHPKGPAKPTPLAGKPHDVYGSAYKGEHKGPDGIQIGDIVGDGSAMGTPEFGNVIDILRDIDQVKKSPGAATSEATSPIAVGTAVGASVGGVGAGVGGNLAQPNQGIGASVSSISKAVGEEGVSEFDPNLKHRNPSVGTDTSTKSTEKKPYYEEWLERGGHAKFFYEKWMEKEDRGEKKALKAEALDKSLAKGPSGEKGSAFQALSSGLAESVGVGEKKETRKEKIWGNRITKKAKSGLDTTKNPKRKKGKTKRTKMAGSVKMTPIAPLFKKLNFGVQLDFVPDELKNHELLVDYNSVSGIRKNLHVGYETAMKMVYDPLESQLRLNLSAAANGFHVKNPYIYNINGRLRAEYICPEEIQKQVGKSAPYGIWHNLDDVEEPDLPEDQIIGDYIVESFDGEKETAKINYKPDWEARANRVLDKMRKLGYNNDPSVADWMDHYVDNVKKGIHGDISTAITTDVQFDSNKQRWIQRKINLKSVSAVHHGNCTKPLCTTKHVAN
jgi:hypothetical protein